MAMKELPPQERTVKAMLDKKLKSLGRMVWCFSPNAGPYGARGIPDRIVCANGVFVGIECKASEKKNPTALQKKCMDNIERAGGHAFLVYDKESIEKALTEIVKLIRDRE